MKLDVRLKQMRSCIVLKDAIAKNFVANEHHSFTFVFTFSVVVVVNLPIDCILSFLFPAQTDVLFPVFSQPRDMVVVNFIVVLKFSIIIIYFTLISYLGTLHWQNSRSRRTNKPITSHGNKHFDQFILLLLFSLPTIWFSLDHQQTEK